MSSHRKYSDTFISERLSVTSCVDFCVCINSCTYLLDIKAVDDDMYINDDSSVSICVVTTLCCVCLQSEEQVVPTTKLDFASSPRPACVGLRGLVEPIVL